MRRKNCQFLQANSTERFSDLQTGGGSTFQNLSRLLGPLKMFVFNSYSIPLSRPPILAARGHYNTASKLLYPEYNKAHHATKVAIGIIVENYSKYRLQDARTSGKANCGANREVDNSIHLG